MIKINIAAQASGTIRATRLIMKTPTLLSLCKKFVIRKPERQKNNAMPEAPIASFSWRAWDPTGNQCADNTNMMLKARHPSRMAMWDLNVVPTDME
jgi:hypothetical protein